jgi:hypothetical protein
MASAHPFDNIGQFDPDEDPLNTAEKWNDYVQEVELFMQVQGIAEDKKQATLLLLAGPKIRKLLQTVRCEQSYAATKEALSSLF